MKKKNITMINVLGFVGCLLWISTIFLRETQITQNETAGFLIGIAPNFGVGLLLPMLVIVYYTVVFKRDIKFKKFIFILISIYALLFMSEIIHDKLLNSSFDLSDMIASLIALGIMALSYNSRKLAAE